ncbi:MAG TPA: hypothetical protein DDW20_02085 [Firmicutes bacterium]|nr:hypothetical protein [Bacillota bacterium]
MEYLKYFDALIENRLITPIWRNIIILIEKELKDSNDKDDYLIIFIILFALIDDGNLCISLDENRLLEKWNNKLNGTYILLSENNSLNIDLFNYVKDKSYNVIHNSLGKINNVTLNEVVGSDKFFEIDDNWLYIKKNNTARKMIIESLDRLFSSSFINSKFDYKSVVSKKLPKPFLLTSGQENVVLNGLNKNLVITGGPGTGKTTSILFLLIGLMINNTYDEIYLLAPSGKAASRMKDSIKGGLSVLSDDFINNSKAIVDRIANLNRYTIHSFLGIDQNTNAFKHNSKNKFKENSIFIIDEASMIDACLFASLLSSIPDKSRVFIMGDKNQLPSVDAGAVFGDLIIKKSLKENGNISELGEAVRFKIGSPIYKLANEVNNENEVLSELPWKNEFLTIQKNENNISNPVYYYLNPLSDKNISQKEIVLTAVKNFAIEYYKDLQDLCTNFEYKDKSELKNLFTDCVKRAEILTAENNGVRGVNEINNFIKNNFLDKSKVSSVDGYYPGELIIVNKNNKSLDLANGDSGVLMTFKDDPTLYFMIEKDSEIIKAEGKNDGKIFKLGGYLFYPFRLISKNEISNAYAITIHKSQGSDYKNILVILPDKKGHPLLNRQIVYTAITRTKGDTYILSNQDRILDAKNTLIVRDTNIN